jgi:hypothetical protein
VGPPPAPDELRPEAEWGFEPELAADVERFARRHGFRVVRIRFEAADDLSPLVAEFYRWWYTRLGQPTNRLFVESFVLLYPYWVLRAGAVPYWMTFNTEPGVEHLARYLGQSDPYDLIEATLVSNGTWTAGLAGPDHWKRIFEHARLGGGFSGVDTERFPSDLAVFVRYRDALRRSAAQAPLPPPVPIPEAEDFLGSYAPELGASLDCCYGSVSG